MQSIQYQALVPRSGSALVEMAAQELGIATANLVALGGQRVARRAVQRLGRSLAKEPEFELGGALRFFFGFISKMFVFC